MAGARGSPKANTNDALLDFFLSSLFSLSIYKYCLCLYKQSSFDHLHITLAFNTSSLYTLIKQNAFQGRYVAFLLWILFGRHHVTRIGTGIERPSSNTSTRDAAAGERLYGAHCLRILRVYPAQFDGFEVRGGCCMDLGGVEIKRRQ